MGVLAHWAIEAKDSVSLQCSRYHCPTQLPVMMEVSVLAL